MSVVLSEHLPLLASAPDGIQKLRGLILELAVRGKLVPQDPKDEPARELLKRIANERARPEAGATRKKIEQMPHSDPREWPFESPIGWKWERFGDIAEIERGGSPRPIKNFLTDDPDGLNWIKIGDTDIGGKYITSSGEKIRREGLTKTRMVYPGDFLLTNSMSFGRPYITQIQGCIHDGWLRISPPNSLDKDYLFTLLSSPFVRKLFVIAAAGAVVMNLNADKVRELPIPLPPLAEQHRIAAKVDELMALCDQLDAEQAVAGAAHARLVETLLGTLTQSTDAAELAANWQRLAEYFDTLFTTESSLEALKQTILQLAVMGRLVPQDTNDEPASELLKRIARERARLEAEGSCKKSKPVPPLGADELPFPCPKGWEWSCLATMALINPRNVTDDSTVVSFVPMAMIGTGFDSAHSHEPRQWAEIKQGFTHFAEGDIGVAKITPCFENSKACVFANLQSGLGAGTTELHIVRPVGHTLVPRYVLAYLKAPMFLLAGETRMTGTAGQKRLPKEFLELNPFPLPPLAEQHRIVAKVDELMALCDRLKADLAESRARQQRLATTLIESALEAA